MNQEMKRRVTACAAGFSLPRYRELPSVGLYLDQTVQLVNSCFRGFPGVELTPSMVSNYVKKGVISHPVKKKYSREQLASLIYIVLSKNVLSLENIDTLFQMQRAHCTAAEHFRCQQHHLRPRPGCRRRKASAARHHRRRREQDVPRLLLRRHAAGGSALAGDFGRFRIKTRNFTASESLSLWERWHRASDDGEGKPVSRESRYSDKQTLCQSDAIAALMILRQHPCPLSHLR